MGESYDVIVVGGGSIGLAAAYHATREGKTALVLERFDFFNDRSGGQRPRPKREQVDAQNECAGKI